MSDSVKNNLQSIQEELISTGASGQDAIGKINVVMGESAEKASKASSAFKKFGVTLLNAFSSVVITMAISAIVQEIQNLLNSYDLLAKKTQEIATNFQSSKKEIDDYATEIRTLRGIMEKETSTTDEVREATSKLYTIQSDLIGTYGAYHDGINLVNGDLTTQLGLLKQINAENAQKAVNDINSQRSAISSGWNLGANIAELTALGTSTNTGLFSLGVMAPKFIKNLETTNDVKKAWNDLWTDSDLLGKDIGYEKAGSTVEKITETWENFESVIKKTDDEKINNLIDSFENFSIVGDELKVAGEVDDVNESVIKLQAKLNSIGYEDKNLEKWLHDVAEETQDIIDSSSAQYETIKYNDIVNGNNAKLTSYYYELAAKNTDIQTAKTAGETEKVKELEEQYKSLLTTISNDSDIDEKYLDYFLDMYPELQDIISEWTFEVKVIPDIEESDVSEGLKDFLNNNSTEYIQAEYDRYLAPGYVDNKGYSAYFKELEDAASLAKKDVDSLVESLHETDGYRVSGKNALLYQPTQTSYTGVEDQKISDWGLSKYADQIKNGTIQSTYGNVDMDNRNIIEWNDWNLARFKEALESWGTAYDEHGNMVRSYYEDLKDAYDEGYSSIDTVYGTVDYFKYDGEEHPIAFTPILVTEDDSIFLGSDEVYEYINGVIKQATEDGDLSAEHILEIDSEGIGFKVGNNYVKGIIAGIDNYTGEGGQSIPATTTGKLMHFSGQYGAYSLAQTGEGQGDYVTPTANRITYDNLYKQEMTTLTEEEEAHNELISKWYEGLSDEAKTYFDGIADTLSEEEIAPTFKMNNEFELSNWLYELQHEADENPIEIKFKTSDLVEDLDTLEDKWDSLSTAYESSVTNAETISATDLQAVTDDFGGIGADEKTGEYNALSSALEKYNEELVENPGDTTVAQNATDRLATAYLDLTGTLEDLIDEDAEYAEEILKANGVENAHEVVTSRLGKVYKGTRKNLEDLAEAVAQWSDNLDDTDQTSQHFLDGLDGIRDSVSNLIALYDENGEVIASSVPELDNNFLIDNLEDIKLATEGDVEALDRLYVALARVNAEQVYVDAGLDTSDFSSDLAEIESLVAYANTLDIENDAYINDSQFMATLQKLLSSSSETASAVEAALSSIGIKISYKTTPKKIRVATDGSGSHVSTVYGGANAGKTVSWDYVDVDEFEVVATKTGSTGTSGTGVKNYSGGSSSSSSGGSGGDSGGSDDTSTDEETFDWVEVAINSLEQELDRLDEAIDDVYDNWNTRNEALADKIEKVTDEIKLQENAAARYEAEAEKYNDIGDEYIQKIKEGVLDIETLEVETSDDDDSDTLIEKIQNYQTWWEKAQEAHDQVGTLTRELGELYKQVFDNIESQYNDLLDEIEKKTDIIEERITRTEEHGFFVDESYYTALKTLEESNYKDLEEEREKLINALNSAVTTKNIEKGSAAWYEMYLKIQDVNKAIEESMTNTVKLNNEIRQLKWDKFDWVEEQMDDFAKEADWLIGLLENRETIDERGYFTSYGLDEAALIGAKYDDALAEYRRIKAEKEALEEIMNSSDTEKIDKENIARLQEYNEALRDTVSASEDAVKANQDLYSEAFKKHLDYLSKLIDKYKDALSVMKSTYEYAKNINEQTKNIGNLEKQLAAYQGDTSEEARKKRQELQNQLNAAQQQLEETQWDKYISETGDMLDNLYDTYETYLNGKLEDMFSLMNNTITMIDQGVYTVTGAIDISTSSIVDQLTGASNGSVASKIEDTTLKVGEGIAAIKEEYGIANTKFDSLGKNTGDILSKWNNGNFTTQSTFTSKIDEILKEFKKVTDGTYFTQIREAVEGSSKNITVNDDGTVSAVDTYDKNNGNGSNGGGGNGTTTTGKEPPSGNTDNPDEFGTIQRVRGKWEQDENGYWYYKNPDGSYLRDSWLLDDNGTDEENDDYWYYLDHYGVMKANEFKDGYWLNESGQMMPDKFSWHETNGKWWYGTDDQKEYARGHVIIDDEWHTFDDNGWWLGKYAKGTKKVPFAGYGLTQDEGSELIYRTSDGSLLTPLGRGDMVFTNEMSQRLWDIANGTVPFGFNLEAPNANTNANQSVTANNNISIELPNVQNYDDFKREMKQDTELEKFWQEITIGQMMGNARLKKNKY